MLTLHGHVLMTLVSQTTCLLRLFFAVPRGDRKKQFLLYSCTYSPAALLFSVWPVPFHCQFMYNYAALLVAALPVKVFFAVSFSSYLIVMC